MTGDTYSSFHELQRHEALDIDYKLTLRDTGSRVTIMAPHGGKIEPRTSDLARRIAGDNYNFYCFEGIKEKDNACLHITSHRFDEPGAVLLASKSQVGRLKLGMANHGAEARPPNARVCPPWMYGYAQSPAFPCGSIASNRSVPVYP